MNQQPRPVQKTRLQADDFVALRSLARYGRWEQGRWLMWRFGRYEEWHSVTYSECPALDAADRLERVGLVEDTICLCGCRRAIIQLTARGKRFVESMDKPAIPIEMMGAEAQMDMVPESPKASLGATSQGPWLELAKACGWQVSLLVLLVICGALWLLATEGYL